MTEGTLRLLDVLNRLAHDLNRRVEADACVVSRVLGEVLVIVTQATADGRSIELGQGFLVPDYPATEAVLRTGRAAALMLDDGDIDPSEAGLLREMGFASLLMVPLELMGEPWGLVELYRRDARRFTVADIAAAEAELSRLP